MPELFDFAELRRDREKIVVAVAGAVLATFYEDQPDAPLVPAFDLMELANEFRTAGADWIEADYRETCLIVAMKKRGRKCIPKTEVRQFDPAPHHAEAVAWARDLLDQTQPGFSRRIFAEWGRQ